MTDYNDIATYRMEDNPERMRDEVRAAIAAGATDNEISAALMRSAWIEQGMCIQERIARRRREITNPAPRHN